jgi:hypothetical protein
VAGGSWQLAPGTWHLAPGTWHLAGSSDIRSEDTRLDATIAPSPHLNPLGAPKRFVCGTVRLTLIWQVLWYIYKNDLPLIPLTKHLPPGPAAALAMKFGTLVMLVDQVASSQ